jgi:uncharacterized membrane protein
LTFAVVLSWERARWQYWTSALLLLATKEDMAIALGAFSVLQWYRAPALPRRAMATLLLSACWLAFAMFVAIPASRTHDGLSGTHNPVFEARFASESGAIDPAVLAGRLVSGRSLGTVVSVLASTAFLPLGGVAWLVPALPGLVISLASKPEEMQATLMAHYAWPVVPWLFMAAATGLIKCHRRAPRLARALVIGLVAWTLVDSPTVRGLPTTHRDPRAAEALAHLAEVPADAVILAQSNLIPHLPKSTTVFAIGADTRPPRDPDWVLLTTVGNLWPLDTDKTAALVEHYRRDAAYEEVFRGPLFGFRRR